MQLRCPACGKVNEADQSSACARCGCDLSSLGAITRAAVWHLSAAARRLRSQQWQAALAQAERSWALRRSADGARLGFLAAGALGGTREVLRWHCRAKQAEDTTLGQ